MTEFIGAQQAGAVGHADVPVVDRGRVAGRRPRPVTVVPARVPARLSQKMLLNSTGLLKVGEPARAGVACSWSLFSEVDSPPGAGSPLDVTAWPS